MPTYEYECRKCGHRFEVFQNMTEEPLKRCRERGCRGKLRRLIGAGAGVIFKGSGFYETDYRSESYKKAVSAEKTSSSSPPADGKGGTESAKKGDSGKSATGGAEAKSATKSKD